MLTIVFYANNGPAAKLRSREIAAVAKLDTARVIDVGFWDGEPTRCDRVEMMPDVPKWQRKRIVAAYGEISQDAELQEPAQEEQEEPTTIIPEQSHGEEKKAVHKGGGRWFVMKGDEKLSGPHDKAEAQRLASSEEVA